jgi:hypothetical protein
MQSGQRPEKDSLRGHRSDTRWINLLRNCAERMLMLALWLILLALSDAIASRIYAGKLERRHKRVCKTLQQALAEVLQAHGLEPHNWQTIA